MKSSLVVILLSSLLFGSCAMPIVKRNYNHKKTNYKKLKQEFSNVVKKKVSILPLFNESPFGGRDLSIIISSELRKELAKTGAFVFKQGGEVLFGSSKDVYAGGGAKLVQLSRRAAKEGINFVFFGRIVDARVRQRADEIGLLRKVKYFSEVKLELRIFDVVANKTIYNETILGFADDQQYQFYSDDRHQQELFKRDLLRFAGRVVARKFIPKVLTIASRLEWSGHVAKIIDSHIYINAGRASGINVGDILKIMTEGQEIYDPTTGAMIGKTKGHLKGTLEVIDYFGFDGAICILHSGGSVQDGDIVTLH